MVKLRITGKDIKHHFDYLGWLYLLIPVLLIFFWSLVYTMTEYRPPSDKVLSFYTVGTYGDQERLDLLELEVAPTFPEMEAMDFLGITIEDAYDYQNMQRLTTYIFAQEGDVYLMDTEMFGQYVQEGMFMPLDGLIDTDIDLSSTTLAVGEDAQEHVYGIPADSLFGFNEKEWYDNRRSVLVVMVFTDNPDESAKLIQWFVENRAAPAPEGIEDWPEKPPVYPDLEEQSPLLVG